ncbi:HdeD family acid-resistance protein [Microtetraspora malaysiensis]|uniref:HdeD family acid-resistance protein n=1 Tax=Microtetraspora malaysiensis TaxID=161358 RepID=UPI003D94C061
MASSIPPGAAGPAGGPAFDRLTVRLATGVWGIAVAAGILSVLLGLAIVVWPSVTIGIVAILFGAKLIIHGVYRTAQAVVAVEVSGATRVLFTLLGVLSFVVGVLVLRAPFHTAAILALLFGLFWLISGIVGFVIALTDRSVRERGWAASLAVLSALMGIALLLWPGITLVAITWTFGLWLITWGILTVALTLWIRRQDRRRMDTGAPGAPRS